MIRVFLISLSSRGDEVRTVDDVVRGRRIDRAKPASFSFRSFFLHFAGLTRTLHRLINQNPAVIYLGRDRVATWISGETETFGFDDPVHVIRFNACSDRITNSTCGFESVGIR